MAGESKDNEIFELKEMLKRLEKNITISEECMSRIDLHTKNESLASKLAKFENSSHYPQEMLKNQRLHNDKKGLGFIDDKAWTSGVNTTKTSKNAVKNTMEDLGQADPFERNPASVSKGIRATVVADTKLKPSMQSRTNFEQITKKTSPTVAVGNTKQPPDFKLGQGLTKGKQVHASHKVKNMVSTTKCLELLHMDLFGPSAIKSYGGNFYTLVIVDDYSRYAWTRFLKSKNKAFDHFEILRPTGPEASQAQAFTFLVRDQCLGANVGSTHGPTGLGTDNESDNASVHSQATNAQQQPNIQPQIITTVSNNNAKFPYLKKDENEVWDMKMEYWITNNDMNIWKVIQNSNSLKRIKRDRDGRVIILPPTTVEEHIAVQKESKARTTLLRSIPDDHVADFHYMDDARDIWNAFKARFGGNPESKRMRNSMLKQEFLEFRIGEAEGLHKGYDRMQKILSQLNQLKAKPEDEDSNLKFLKALPSSWSQVALTLKTKGGLQLLSFDDLYYKLKTLEVDVKGYTTFSLSQSTGLSHSAFVSATSASKKMSYGDSLSYSSTTTYSIPSNSKTGSHRSGNIEKLDLEEMDLKWQMAMLSIRVHKFEQKAKRNIDFDKKESARFNKKKRYSSFKIKEIRKKEDDSKALIIVDMLVDWTDHNGESDGVIASKEFGMTAGCDTKDEIEEGTAKIYNLITGADTEEASTAGDAREFVLMGVTSEWRTSSKNLYRLIDSSMSVRTKVGLGFNNYIRENELGWDDSAFSVFTTNSKDVKGRPLFNRFAKDDSIKAMPPPLSGDYTSLSDHIDLDESQMFYGTKSSTSSDSKSVSNDFVSCDDIDKSSEVNTNDFASSDLRVKSSEPKPNDSTSCASTSSVSTSENEAEIESNVGTPTQEPIIVQDLPSFSCNSSDKNENTSRTSCNKNGYFNKKAVLFRTGNVNISPARPQPVPTGKPKMFAPVLTGRQNRPFLVPTDGGYSSSENHFPDTEDEGIFDSGCSRSMTGNKERLDDFQVIQGEKVTFGGDEGRITGKGTIRTPTLDFENVYYVKELQQFNLFSISQICDKKNRVLFTVTECLVLSKDFKLPDESMVNKKVKAMRCDNGTEFKNAYIIELFGSKGIKKEYSNARTPQQNRVAERKNKTFIEAARTMLADSKLPTMFWTEVVRTACYVLNRVLVTSPHNKTPYALVTGNIPYVSHFKPFGCHVTILNTSDHLGKFDGKADEGYIVGYATSNKAYRGLGHEWYFDLDYLIDTLGYKHDKANQSARTQEATTNRAGTQDVDLDSDCDEQVIIVPSYPSHSISRTKPKDTSGDEVDDSPLNSVEEIFQKELARLKGQEQRATSDAENLGLGFANDAEELQKIHASSSIDSFFDDEPTTRLPSPSDLGNHDSSPGIFFSSSYDDEYGAALNNVASTEDVSPVATKRINIIHPQSLIIRDHTSAVQTRSKVKQTTTGESAFISNLYVQQRDNHTDFQHCLFACFLFQVKPRSVAQALKDPSWVDAMQEEIQQFKFQNVWVLVDFPAGKYAIGTKWILKNNRDARVIVVRNKARLVAQGHRQEEGIDYDEVFDPVAKIEAIQLFLAFASYMGFMVYQMDVKSAFLYERIDEEVYVTQPKGFVDPQHPKKVYKVVKALYRLHQAPRAWYATLSTFLLKHGYRRGTIDKTLFLKKNNRDIILQRPDGIFINQDKYVQEILNKFDLGSVKTATTPYEAPKPKSKTKSDSLLNVPLYRSMIGSLMYLTASKPDIMFAVNACSRNQVTPTTSNLEAVKKIFKYLKGQPKWGLWYPRESPLMLEAYSDSDYAGTNKDRKSTTGGCQFLADDGGIDDLPIAEIYSGMDNLGPIVVTLICLSDGRRYNWSSYIFKGMVSNIGNAKKFLMYPRFLQAILGIEIRIKRQYKVLMFSSKLFANMSLNFEGHPMPLLPAMLLQAQAGEGAGLAAQAVPQHMPAPDQPQDHLSTPSRQQTSDPNAPVFKHGQSSDPNIASFSQTHKTADGPFTNVEDTPLGGSFHMSPPRSTQAPPAETDLNDHKKLFKDVVGKLVKKVKAMEVKLKTKKRKMVVSDSDQEEGEKKDVDLDALRALANAAMTVDSNIPPGGASNNPAASTSVHDAVSTGASTVPACSPSVPADVPPSVAPTGVSNKGKSPMVEEEIHVKARTFKQMQEDILGEQAAKRLHDEEQAQLDRQRAELQRRRQQESLLGDDVSADNFPAKMAALIKRKKQALAEKLTKERRNMPMNQAQQRTYMRQFVKNQSSAVYSTRRKEPSSKRQKSTEAPIPSVPKVPQSPVVSSPKSSGTKRKSFSRKCLTKPKSKLIELDLDVDDQTFIKVLFVEDSEDEAPPVWPTLVGWEVITTPLGDINALYRIDRSTKHFITLRQILHMVDRQDLVKLYGLVVKYYETHHAAGVRLILWGDLQVLYMFVNVSYPLLVKLMEMMLMHKLEIDKDVVGNDMTTAEQLIQYVVPTGRVVVPTGRVVVPTGMYVVPAADRRVFVLDFGLQSISHVNAATAMILMLLLEFSTVRAKDLCCPSKFVLPWVSTARYEFVLLSLMINTAKCCSFSFILLEGTICDQYTTAAKDVITVKSDDYYSNVEDVCVTMNINATRKFMLLEPPTHTYTSPPSSSFSTPPSIIRPPSAIFPATCRRPQPPPSFSRAITLPPHTTTILISHHDMPPSPPSQPSSSSQHHRTHCHHHTAYTTTSPTSPAAIYTIVSTTYQPAHHHSHITSLPSSSRHPSLQPRLSRRAPSPPPSLFPP
uniref:Integrase catalytic domain-containing protein n=1 Tax=Tanacetum cinerariifolium TaxID=118510 RepID=A0A6L2J8L8_TANCI|nr:hypothetical protein [Tanacetum cinerariifolium]